MKARAQGLGLAILAYLVTLGLTFLIALLIIMIMMDATDCGSVSQTLAVLGGTIAVLFIASTAVVAVRARKVLPSGADRVVIVVLYGVILLASYVVIACGLMVIFNC